MQQVFDATCTSMDVSFPRPIPGYGIQWNIKLQFWERLFNAEEVCTFTSPLLLLLFEGHRQNAYRRSEGNLQRQ